MKSTPIILKLPAIVSQVKENRPRTSGVRCGWNVTVMVIDGKGGQSEFYFEISEDKECPKLGDPWQMILAPKTIEDE